MSCTNRSPPAKPSPPISLPVPSVQNGLSGGVTAHILLLLHNNRKKRESWEYKCTRSNFFPEPDGQFFHAEIDIFTVVSFLKGRITFYAPSREHFNHTTTGLVRVRASALHQPRPKHHLSQIRPTYPPLHQWNMA